MMRLAWLPGESSLGGGSYRGKQVQPQADLNHTAPSMKSNKKYQKLPSEVPVTFKELSTVTSICGGLKGQEWISCYLIDLTIWRRNENVILLARKH